MHIRKLNILVHRYIGYFFFGLTVVYSISGIAVNHIEDWNPNYMVTSQTIKIEPLKNKEEISEKEVKDVFAKLSIPEKKYNEQNIFYPSEKTIQIILAKDEKLILNIEDNTANYESVSRRPVLHLFNFLHLNKAQKAWTYYADFYAFCLLIIAISGMFMKKGKEGFWGKGGILALAGILVPFIFVYLYYD